jgi:hypothetical protein
MLKIFILFSAILASNVTIAQTFSTKLTSVNKSSVDTGYLRGPSAITQSTDPATITPVNVGCQDGATFFHTDNSYLRRFDLDGMHMITDWFDVTSVDIAIETATSGTGGTQPVSIRIYSILNADPFVFSNLTLVGSLDTTIADMTATIVNFPITGSVGGTNKDLVVELFTPDGRTDSHSIRIGSNAAGELAPSFIIAAECGITEPTTNATIGFPDMHYVMTVNGSLNMVPVELQNFSVE